MSQMNREMVDAKIQLEAAKSKVVELTEALKKSEETLAQEREQSKKEFTILEEQILAVTKRNNDLSWSNEELLQMRHNDETYVELQDTRAMMKALKQLSEELYKKYNLQRVMYIAERRRSRLLNAMGVLRVESFKKKLSSNDDDNHNINTPAPVSIESPHPLLNDQMAAVEQEEQQDEGEPKEEQKQEEAGEVEDSCRDDGGKEEEEECDRRSSLSSSLLPPPPPSSHLAEPSMCFPDVSGNDNNHKKLMFDDLALMNKGVTSSSMWEDDLLDGLGSLKTDLLVVFKMVEAHMRQREQRVDSTTMNSGSPTLLE